MRAELSSRICVVIALAAMFAGNCHAQNEQNGLKMLLSHCAIAGVVVDASNGLPAQGATVAIPTGRHEPVITNSAGQFSIEQVTCGTHHLYAKKDGYTRLPEIRTARLLPQVTTHITLPLYRDATLSGRIVDENNNPVSEASVKVWVRALVNDRPVLFFRGSSTSDDQGQYQITGLPGGNYYVSATKGKATLTKEPTSTKQPQSKQQSPTFAGAFYPGVQSPEQSLPIHLRRFENMDGVNLVLKQSPSFCISASTAGANTRPHPSNVVLMLFQSSPGWYTLVGNGAVQGGEHFRFCGLIPGTQYKLAAMEWHENSRVSSFTEQPFVGTEEDVIKRERDLGVLFLRSGGRVPGRVRVADHESDDPLPQVKVLVSLQPLDRPQFINESLAALPDSHGEFTFGNVLPYERWISVRVLTPGYYVKTVRDDRYDLLEHQWQARTGDIRVLLANDGATLKGTVTDSDGAPVPDAVVFVARKSSPDFSTRIAADQNGQFQSVTMAPGDYLVLAVAGLTGDESGDPDIVRTYLSRGSTMTLSPRENRSLNLIAVEK